MVVSDTETRETYWYFELITFSNGHIYIGQEPVEVKVYKSHGNPGRFDIVDANDTKVVIRHKIKGSYELDLYNTREETIARWNIRIDRSIEDLDSDFRNTIEKLERKRIP